FDLNRTAAPVAWGRGRWPNVHWTNGSLIWCGSDADEAVVWRSVSQFGPAAFRIEGTAQPAGDRAWLSDTLGIDAGVPTFDDERLRVLLERHAGMRPFAHGSLWEGLAGSIVGQGVSVAGGATLLSRIAALVHPGVALAGRTLWPLPEPAEIAALGADRLRGVGLTRQRAEALAAAATAMRDGALSKTDPLAFRDAAMAIRGIGRWTIESTLLWGVGDADIHPSGDIALLRAARHVFADPALTMRGLDEMSERWRPYRSWAARLLWLELLGPAA
ncbi:MAG TPA: hypothetical protein VFX03_09595, partial [Thermomicrobiales bacterium]|nr:hypothetical protein [Thermomicrobiales bacterium]